VIALVLVVGGILFLSRRSSGPPVRVSIRIEVTPPEQSGFVAGQMSSSRFKYLAGKLAGVGPAIAQKLTVKPVANSPLLDAEVHMQTREEAQKYLAGFLETLQTVCDTQAQVALKQQSIQ